jgi:hypothetical protein
MIYDDAIKAGHADRFFCQFDLVHELGRGGRRQAKPFERGGVSDAT